MELFERIRFFLEHERIPLVELAKILQVPAFTFNQWFKKSSEKNFWNHLPTIVKTYPQLNKKWLYLGEGEMLVSSEDKKLESSLSEEEVTKLKQEITDLNQLNRDLTKCLLENTRGGQGDSWLTFF